MCKSFQYHLILTPAFASWQFHMMKGSTEL